MRFVLASASPARLATLRAAGVEPEVIVSGVDEESIEAPITAELVTLLATQKARAVASRVGVGALVLGCDSLLELDGRSLGKPGTPGAARERWRAMRGRTGTLHTGHHLIDTDSNAEVTRAGLSYHVFRLAPVTRMRAREASDAPDRESLLLHRIAS